MKDDDLYENATPAEAGDFNDLPETAMTGLAVLAERAEQLMEFCERLARENQALREQNAVLQAERDTLHQKYEQSRARIEAMIVRMKGLEQAS